MRKRISEKMKMDMKVNKNMNIMKGGNWGKKYL
jgi:hypothetical protein